MLFFPGCFIDCLTNRGWAVNRLQSTSRKIQGVQYFVFLAEVWAYSKWKALIGLVWWVFLTSFVLENTNYFPRIERSFTYTPNGFLCDCQNIPNIRSSWFLSSQQNDQRYHTRTFHHYPNRKSIWLHLPSENTQTTHLRKKLVKSKRDALLLAQLKTVKMTCCLHLSIWIPYNWEKID